VIALLQYENDLWRRRAPQMVKDVPENWGKRHFLAPLSQPPDHWVDRLQLHASGREYRSTDAAGGRLPPQPRFSKAA
jgi:hypothetical protein